MNLQEAHSHALRQVNALIAFRTVEEVLRLALGAQTVQREAEEATTKVQGQKTTLENAIEKLVIAHDKAAVSIKRKVAKAQEEAVKVADADKAAHTARMATLDADLQGRQEERDDLLDQLDTQIIEEKRTLATLVVQAKDARERLNALRAGLENVK